VSKPSLNTCKVIVDLFSRQLSTDGTMGLLTMFALGSYVAGFFLSVPFFYLLYGRSFQSSPFLQHSDFVRGIVGLIGEGSVLEELE
jgi:hypothetical protein